MKIDLFEPRLARDPGFYRHVFRALIRCRGARTVEDPRPLPQVTEPRQHVSAWTRFDGHLVFFDMSDHVFFYDLEALKRCDVYFKTNLNRGVTDKVLAQDGLESHRAKIVPFFSFAGYLDLFNRRSLRNRVVGALSPRRRDVSHIVGVYENLVHDGETSIFAEGGPQATPARYHFWVRYHVRTELERAGLTGYYRLTSRNNPAIEDGALVRPNLSQRAYIRQILSSSFTVINTLPHALLPWKASESLHLGRPVVLDTAPLVEIPEPFTLKPGVHFLELMPGLGDFDRAASLDDPNSYRLFAPLDLGVLAERCAWLERQVSDRDRVAFMCEAAVRYSERVLNCATVADYVCDAVREKIH